MNNLTKNKLLIVTISLTAGLLITMLALVSCTPSQEKITCPGKYPNVVAENANIPESYTDLTNKITEEVKTSFFEIANIPHVSGHVEGMRNYLLNWAKQNNVNATLDSSGCVYYDLPATSGHEKDKNILFQVHMDMVATADKNYKEFDPETSPIDLVFDKDTQIFHSKDYKTNIGADDAQGMCLALALSKLQKNYEHGPIRIIFTYDEETTFEGVNKLDANILNGDYLINFDSNPVGFAAIGSTGNFPIKFSKKYATAGPTEKGASENMTIIVKDLKGGHSGTDINLGRNSASAFLIKYLNILTDEKIHFRIASIKEDFLFNVIPSSFELTLNINKKHEEEAKTKFEELAKELKQKFPNDANFNYDISINEASGMFPSQQDSEKILEVLNVIPNGVIKVSEKNNEEVISSCNIGGLNLENGILTIDSLFRSTDNEILANENSEIQNKLKSLKIDMQTEEGDPAWSPSESSLSKMYEKCMKEQCNIIPTLECSKGALELSIINEKKPSIQLISIGADLEDEHMTSEKLYMKTFPVAVVPVLYIIEHVNELD